jgi:hypothetical protein
MEWINVNDRLPDNMERVIIRTRFRDTEKRNTTVGHYIKLTGYWMFISNLYYKVTHWMPLPLPPKE